MRIRTNHVKRSDLLRTLDEVNPMLQLEVHGGRSRTHAQAFDVGLEYYGIKEKGDGRYRRNRNINSGFDEPFAATYDEWGEWIAKLFEIDPDAIIGQYRNRADFHRVTNGKYWDSRA